MKISKDSQRIMNAAYGEKYNHGGSVHKKSGGGSVASVTIPPAYPYSGDSNTMKKGGDVRGKFGMGDINISRLNRSKC